MNHVDTSSINHISLCSGYGGIDLGLKRAVGERLRTVAYVEIEAFAAANLVAKAEAGLLDAAPVWSDLRSFPWGKFHGLVDILSGGYPCQPFSAAGKRRGHEDPRHLWPAIAAGIAVMRPTVCFFENVEGHITLGLRDVLHDLGELGYRATWGIFSASVDAGAPHQRKRVFVMAHRNGDGLIRNVARATALTFGDRSQDGVSGADGELAHRHGERGQLPDWWRVAAEQVPVGDGEARRDELEHAELHGRQDRQHDNAGTQFGCGHSTAWPSRPGEPQHGWEPPRVIVGDTEGGQSNGRKPGDMGQTSGEWRRGDHAADGAGENVGDAQSGGLGKRRDAPRQGSCGHADCPDEVVADDNSLHARHGEQRPERTLGDLSGGCGEAGAMGNASIKGRWGLDDEPSTCGQREAGGHADRTSNDAGQVGRQTQPSLGGDADGPASGLGLSEHTGLSDNELAEIRQWMERVDNRTDELRLLGNGVLAQCAAVAFRTLWEELLK